MYNILRSYRHIYAPKRLSKYWGLKWVVSVQERKKMRQKSVAEFLWIESHFMHHTRKMHSVCTERAVCWKERKKERKTHNETRILKRSFFSFRFVFQFFFSAALRFHVVFFFASFFQYVHFLLVFSLCLSTDFGVCARSLIVHYNGHVTHWRMYLFWRLFHLFFQFAAMHCTSLQIHAHTQTHSHTCARWLRNTHQYTNSSISDQFFLECKFMFTAVWSKNTYTIECSISNCIWLYRFYL